MVGMRLNFCQRATARSNSNSLNSARDGSGGVEDTENNNNNNTKRVLAVGEEGEGGRGGESSKHSAESSFLIFFFAAFIRVFGLCCWSSCRSVSRRFRPDAYSHATGNTMLSCAPIYSLCVSG